MRWWCGLSVVLILGGAVSSAEDDLPWWRTALFYQVYPRSFMDSDGDGVGDLKGINMMASYFSDIGVDCIWICPFQPSPMKDFGYDISNYTAVDPLFGTMDDFKEILTTMQALGIKVVIDFVPNHTSDEHPWFVSAVAGEDPYVDYYIWNDGRYDEATGNNSLLPNNWLSVVSGGAAWTWYDERNQYNFHDFFVGEPDLNYTNPLVHDEIEAIMRFWLDMGVDGLRIDSALYLYEIANYSTNETQIPGTDGSVWDDFYHNCTQNLPNTYTLLQRWAEIVYNYTLTTGQERGIFIEAYTDLAHTMEYYGSGNTSLMQPFNFFLLTSGNDSSRAPAIKTIIDNWMDNMPSGEPANWVVGNHDNSRVTERYGTEMVDAINMLTMALPGVKVTYYGEEIGMQDTFIRWDQTQDPGGLDLGEWEYTTSSRDPERTPMQWDATAQSNFSTNASTWLPLNPNYWWLNVAAQKAASSSHLKVFIAMAQVRKDAVLQRGEHDVIAPDNDTLVVVRSYNSSYYVLLINWGSDIREYTSANLFQTYNIDIDMEIVVGSMNYDGPSVGETVTGGSLSFTLRPKAAVFLKSYTATSNDTSNSTSAATAGFSTSSNYSVFLFILMTSVISVLFAGKVI